MRNVAQGFFGQLVGFSVVIDKKYRSPQHRPAKALASRLLCAVLEFTEELLKEFAKGQCATVQFGVLVNH